MTNTTRAALVSLALIACTSDKPKAPAETSAGDTAARLTWVVTPGGIGPVTAGMTLDEANTVTHQGIEIPAKLDECAYVRLTKAPAGVALMVENGIVSRVDVTEGPVATTEGARIGDSEDRIESLYPGQVKVMPHKYTAGHYLVVTPASGGENRIVFETDGGKVVRYRSGREPAVEYVEGCG